MLIYKLGATDVLSLRSEFQEEALRRFHVQVGTCLVTPQLGSHFLLTSLVG